jgi:hypothetical protein
VRIEREKRTRPSTYEKDDKYVWVLWKRIPHVGPQDLLTATLVRRDMDKNINERGDIVTSSPFEIPGNALMDLYKTHKKKWPAKGAGQRIKERYAMSKVGLDLYCVLHR